MPLVDRLGQIYPRRIYSLSSVDHYRLHAEQNHGSDFSIPTQATIEAEAIVALRRSWNPLNRLAARIRIHDYRQWRKTGEGFPGEVLTRLQALHVITSLYTRRQRKTTAAQSW